MQPALSQMLEAIIFVSDQPVQAAFLLKVVTGKTEATETDDPEASSDSQPLAEAELKGNNTEAEIPAPDPAVESVTMEEVEAALADLLLKYQDIRYPFEIRKVAGGYQFYTKRQYYPYVRKAVVNKNQRRLSRAALETLSIVAYRQPITKAEVEFIRGVNCDYAIQKLLEKNLVSITGRADAPGRPLLYSTSPFFMEYFGISDISDLPKLKEFADMEEDQMNLFRQTQPQDPHETETGKEAILEGGDSGREGAEETPSQDLE